jgi:hypothetical protein
MPLKQRGKAAGISPARPSVAPVGDDAFAKVAAKAAGDNRLPDTPQARPHRTPAKAKAAAASNPVAAPITAQPGSAALPGGEGEDERRLQHGLQLRKSVSGGAQQAAPDANELRRMASTPRRGSTDDAPAPLNAQIVAGGSARYAEQYGSRAGGRAAYCDLREPWACGALTAWVPRWLVVRYKRVEVYEFKDDAKLTPSGARKNDPMEALELHHDRGERPAIEAFTATGGRAHCIHLVVPREGSLATTFEAVVDCKSEREQMVWLALLQQALDRGAEDAFEAEQRDDAEAKARRDKHKQALLQLLEIQQSETRDAERAVSGY